jgi:hypothetical protein
VSRRHRRRRNGRGGRAGQRRIHGPTHPKSVVSTPSKRASDKAGRALSNAAIYTAGRFFLRCARPVLGGNWLVGGDAAKIARFTLVKRAAEAHRDLFSLSPKTRFSQLVTRHYSDLALNMALLFSHHQLAMIDAALHRPLEVHVGARVGV